MPEEHLVQNVAAILKSAPPKIPRKWANIRSISVKTTDSAALPIYNKTPEELMEIAKLAGLEDHEEAAPAAEKAKETNKEKKRKHKSPLVQALKQLDQVDSKDREKKEEEERESKKAKIAEAKTDVGEHPTREMNSKKMPKADKKSKRKESIDDTEITSSKAAKETHKSERKSSRDEVEEERFVRKAKTVGAKKEVEELPDGEKKSKQTSKVDKISKRKQRIDETDAAASKAATKTKSEKKSSAKKEEKQDFIASRKYIGSKRSYVFRKGSKGVGYYVDVPPVVDKMAMEALRRLADSQGKGSGKPKRQGKSRRGRR
jgi:ribosome biogenesis protein UTP30